MVKHGSWPNVTDKESIAIKTLSANILNDYTISFFEKSCINTLKKKTVSHSQVGFIPDMQGWFDIWKSMCCITSAR